MSDGSGKVSEQERKKSILLELLSRQIDDAFKGQFYGEFTVIFSTSNGNIIQIKEKREQTYK